MTEALRSLIGESSYQNLRHFYRKLRGKETNEIITHPNIISDQLIVCNLCGAIFPRSDPNHSEFLSCPNCGEIARDRVVTQIILQEAYWRTKQWHPLLSQTEMLKSCRLLECSPRRNATRQSILEKTFLEYLASDFEMSSHQAEVKIDLTDAADIAKYRERFDFIICAHVLEHIPDYDLALHNLKELLAPGGTLILQVPILESKYTKVTWDEFHGDNTRVFHRFGFDLLVNLSQVFEKVIPVVGQMDFSITCPEISTEKYLFLQTYRDQCLIFGEDILKYNGLGNPDLCDAFIAYKR